MRAGNRSIHEADCRAMLALINELHALPPHDVAARANYFLTQLCVLLRAKVGLVGVLRDSGGASWEQAPFGFFEHGWPCDAERSAVMAYHDDARRDPQKYADPMAAMLAESDRVVTRRREELHGDGFWYSRANVNEHRRPGRIDDCIYSLNRVAPGWIIGLAVHREWGDGTRFDAREAGMLAILHEQAGFLWRDVLACGDGATAALPRRLRQTLDLLLGGHSEKEIAARLSVSRNTVHKYVTGLYRRLGVNSRAELMARQFAKP